MHNEHAIIVRTNWIFILDDLAVFVKYLISHCGARVGLLQQRFVNRLWISAHDGMHCLGNFADVALKDIAAQTFAAHTLAFA